MEIRIAFFFSKKKKKVKSLHELFTMVFPHPFCRKQKAVTHLLPLPFSTTTTTTFVSPHPPGDRSCSANEDRTRVCVCVYVGNTFHSLSLITASLLEGTSGLCSLFSIPSSQGDQFTSSSSRGIGRTITCSLSTQ